MKVASRDVLFDLVDGLDLEYFNGNFFKLNSNNFIFVIVQLTNGHC